MVFRIAVPLGLDNFDLMCGFRFSKNSRLLAVTDRELSEAAGVAWLSWVRDRKDELWELEEC